MKRIFAVLLVAVCFVTLVIPMQPAKAASTVQSTLNVHALYLKAYNGNVGEGDAVLLESNDHYLLMDTGIGYYPYADSASTLKQKDVSKSIMSYLDKLGVDKTKTLDIYISHIHNDHFGALYGIITSGKYNIGKLYVPAKTIANAEDDHGFIYRNVFSNTNNQYEVDGVNYFEGIQVVYLSPTTINCGSETVKSSFTFGNATVKIIGPVRLCTSSLMTGGDTDKVENNNSLCAVVTSGKNKYLTIGDALDFEEKDLVSKYKNTTTLKADLFKEDHHGYAKSGNFLTNIDSLIDLVKPKYAFCQNYVAQSNVTVPRAIRRTGEALDVYTEGKAIVYQLITMSDGTTKVSKSLCSHSIDKKTFTASQLKLANCSKTHETKVTVAAAGSRIDPQHHTMSIKCTGCNKTVTIKEEHTWNSNGKCLTCGYQCTHSYINENGETKPYYTSPTESDHTCYICRMPCKHAEWWTSVSGDTSKSKCKTCYLVCDHSKTTTKTTQATKTTDGKIVKSCSVCKKVKSTTTIYHPSSYKLSTSTYTYDGKAKSPSISIYDTKGNKLVKGTDYTVTSPSGRTNVGKYTFKINLTGKYTGTATLTITIKPKETTLSSLTPIKNGFKVVWAKQATQTTGYQIQAAANSSFTSDVHSYTYSSASTTSASITKNLTAGKKYYVRVRTFKTVTVNGKSEKIYSSWSTAKSATTKK